MGKWAKPDLSDLENDLLNNSMKSISSHSEFTVDQYHPQEAVYKKYRKVIIMLLRKLAKHIKTAKFDPFWTFRNDL